MILKRIFPPPVFVPSAPATFNPHAHSDRLAEFNCYADAMDLPSAGMARPGRLASFRNNPLNTDEIIDWCLIRLLEKDGWKEIREHEVDPDRQRVIGVYWGAMPGFNGLDFHVVKKTPQGWVQKIWDNANGTPLPPANRDFSGNVMNDLEQADMGPYKYRVGYFAESKAGLLIRRRNDIQDRSCPVEGAVAARVPVLAKA